jgi:hypothetical protein
MNILYTTNIKAFRFVSIEILGSVKNQGKLRFLENWHWQQHPFHFSKWDLRKYLHQ